MSFYLPKLTAAAFTALALIGSQQVQAESHGDEDERDKSEISQDPSAGGEVDPGSIRSGNTKDTTPAITKSSTRAAPTATMTTTVTASIVASLNASTSYCKQIEAGEYVIDCLAERLEEVNRQIEGLEGYEEVSEVLAKTAGSLSQIAKQNRSETLLPAWYSTPGKTPVATERPLIPVDEDKLEDAMAQALSVIQDAETTLLLRSSEASASRATQYQRIANAIGSNKVLLRSTG